MYDKCDVWGGGYLGPGGEETPPVDDCEDGRGVNSTKGLQRNHHHHGCVKMVTSIMKTTRSLTFAVTEQEE